MHVGLYCLTVVLVGLYCPTVVVSFYIFSLSTCYLLHLFVPPPKYGPQACSRARRNIVRKHY